MVNRSDDYKTNRPNFTKSTNNTKWNDGLINFVLEINNKEICGAFPCFTL